MLRIRDVYPGSWFLPIPDPGTRIPDPKTAIKERGEKKIYFHRFFGGTNFTKCKIILFLNCRRKKLGQILKNYRTFSQKVVTKLSKIWVWDPRSGIRDKPIPDPGSRGQKGTGFQIPDSGSRIRIRNSAAKFAKKNFNLLESLWPMSTVFSECKPAFLGQRKTPLLLFFKYNVIHFNRNYNRCSLSLEDTLESPITILLHLWTRW